MLQSLAGSLSNAGHTTGVFYLHRGAPMPYSMDEPDKLPDAVKKLGEKDQARWVAVFNSAHDKCMEEDGDDCEGSAFAQANGVVMKKEDALTAATMPIARVANVRCPYCRTGVQVRDQGYHKCRNCLETFYAMDAEDDDNEVYYTYRKAYAQKFWEYEPDKRRWAEVAKRSRMRIGEIIGDAVRRFWYGPDGGPQQPAQPVDRSSRALTIGQIYDRVMNALHESRLFGEYAMPLDIYHEGADMFMMVNDAGKLYRVGLTLDEDDNVTLSEPTEVTVSFRPVNQRTVSVTRQADGRYRWFIVAASAVLNRVGEIDSTQLFDSFISNAQQRGMPILTFWHMSRSIQLGVADYIGRDDYLYLASGLFDGSPDGKAAAQSLARDATGWGASIGYFPDESPDFIEVERGVTLPVYVSGWNEEISLLPEAHAASWFTAVSAAGMEVRMQAQTKEALVKLLGQALADEREREIDAANATVRENRMIARDTANRSGTEATDEAQAEETEEAETQTPAVSADGHIDGNASESAQAETPVAQAESPSASAPDYETMTRSMTEAMTTMQAQMAERLDAMTRSVTAQAEALQQLLQVVDDVAQTTADVSARVTEMETEAQAEEVERENDMPAGSIVPAANQLYRPRMSLGAGRATQRNQNGNQRDLSSVASSTLSNLKPPRISGRK